MSLGVKGDLKQEIFNEVNENVRALERLFPSTVKDGQVDFEALKEELGQFEEVGPEKYGLTWSGKQNAKKLAQEDIVGKTLKYIPEDGKNLETTENLYIEGDNLEVLKLLRQNYYGAIKMIYIDPPYNTGNDFVYKDKFDMDKVESDIEEGNLSELGERYTVNSKSSNKYHANWLNMMYPRLKVAKDLLKDNGVIFISIDDNEITNLKYICNEVFGEENFIGTFIINSTPNARDYGNIGKMHEFALFYAKNIELVNTNLIPDKEKEFKYKDEIGGFNIHPLYNSNVAFTPENRPNLYYPFYVYKYEKLNGFYKIGLEKKEHSVEVYPPKSVKDNVQFVWRWGKEKSEKNMNIDIVGYKVGDEYRIVQKMRHDAKVIRSIINDKEVTSRRGTAELEEILGGKIFNFPKPVELIKKFLISGSDSDDIIMDFFAGSCTTAHSIMKLNIENMSNRKYILVQYPEKIDSKSEAGKRGYRNICEIGKERIRRAGEKIKEENKDKEGIEGLDVGFKVFRVGDTNIRWNYEKEDLKTLSNEVTIRSNEEQTTFDFIAATNHQVNLDETVSAKDRLDFMPGAKDIDIVYEILLRQRDIPLSAKVELLEDIGKRTYIFADSYLVCLEEDITAELIEKLAELSPLPIKFILRDSAFGDDIALKDEAYRRLKALIERNSGESKKTYTVEFI